MATGSLTQVGQVSIVEMPGNTMPFTQCLSCELLEEYLNSSTQVSSYPSIHPPPHPPTHQSIYPLTHASIYIPTHPSIMHLPPVHLSSSTHPLIHPSIHPPTYLLISLPVPLPPYPPTHSPMHISTYLSIHSPPIRPPTHAHLLTHPFYTASNYPLTSMFSHMSICPSIHLPTNSFTTPSTQ